MAANILRLVASLALVALTGCNAILRPSKPDTNWHVYERGHFVFHVRPGSFAEQQVDNLGPLLEDQFAVSRSRLGLTYDGRIAMYLYNSGSDAGLSDDSIDGDHSGVAFPETEAVKAACVSPLNGNLFALLAHEANHVITHKGLGRPGTTLLNEALASAIVSESHYAVGPSFYYAWTAAHRAQIPPIANLADDNRWRDYPSSLAYTAGASFLAYLIETEGAARLRQIYYANSSSFAAKFQEVYGRSLATAHADWLAFCDQRAAPPTVDFASLRTKRE